MHSCFGVQNTEGPTFINSNIRNILSQLDIFFKKNEEVGLPALILAFE
jgi:hypothetical protein